MGFLKKYGEDYHIVKEGFSKNIMGGWYTRFLMRPTSFLITPLFISAKLTPNQVTVLRFFIGVTGLVLIASGNYVLSLWGCALYYTCTLLDYVDGNVARYYNKATYLGKFLDGTFDCFLTAALPLSLACSCYFTTGNVLYIFVGTGISFMCLFSFFIQSKFSFYRNWIKLDKIEGKIKNFELENIDLSYTPGFFSSALIHNYIIFGLGLAVIFSVNEYFLLGLAIISFLWSVHFVGSHFIQAKTALNVPRKSRHAS